MNIVLSGCERRELTYPSPYPLCDVLVNVDWSDVYPTPTGMTVMFFPTDDTAPTTVQTNTIHSASPRLRKGTYHVVVFNQIPSDFGTLEFRGMDHYSTMEVCATATTSKWYKTKANNDKIIVREPELFAADRYENFEVTDAMVETSMQNRARSKSMPAVSLNLKPMPMIYTATVRVKIEGIQNVRSMRGSLGGMAQGAFIATAERNSHGVTHLLEEWTVTKDEGSATNGEAIVMITTFGQPLNALLPTDSKLFLSFLLVDNQTIINKEFNVGDLMQKDEHEFTITIQIGMGTKPGEEPRPEDDSVELPNVKPEGGSDSGFDAEIDGWDEEENVDIPME